MEEEQPEYTIIPFIYILKNNLKKQENLKIEEISLENINRVKENPKKYALNTNISNEKLLLTELKTKKNLILISLSNLDPKKYKEKIEILEKKLNSKIYCGYNFFYSYKDFSELKKSKSLYKEDFLYRKLFREFFDNKNNDYKFVGPVYIEDIWEFDDLKKYKTFLEFTHKFLFFMVYFKFCVKFNFPLIFDVSNLECLESNLNLFDEFLDTLDKNGMIKKDDLLKKLFFLNFKIEIVIKNKFENNKIISEKEFSNVSILKKFLEKNYQIGISLENFDNFENLNFFLNFFDRKLLENLFISPIYSFCTSFKIFGSSLIDLYSICVEKSKNKNSIFYQIFYLNPKKIVYQKKIVQKEIEKVEIVCDICNNTFFDSSKQISKDGKTFCGLDCFKLYLSTK